MPKTIKIDAELKNGLSFSVSFDNINFDIWSKAVAKHPSYVLEVQDSSSCSKISFCIRDLKKYEVYHVKND